MRRPREAINVTPAEAGVGALDINARTGAAGGRRQREIGQQIDDGLLQCAHKAARAEAEARQIKKGVENHLPGTMMGDLPTAVAADDGNASYC